MNLLLRQLIKRRDHRLELAEKFEKADKITTAAFWFNAALMTQEEIDNFIPHIANKNGRS